MTGFEAHHRAKARDARIQILSAFKRGARKAEAAARAEAMRLRAQYPGASFVGSDTLAALLAEARAQRAAFEDARRAHLAEGWNLP